MSKKDSKFLQKLLSTFKIEAQEHISAISSGLIALEKIAVAEKQIEAIEAIFREVHSLKGAARAVNLMGIEAICQSLESLLARLKQREIALSPALLGLLHKAADSLSKLLSLTDASAIDSERPMIDLLIRQLDNALDEARLSRQHESRHDRASGIIAAGQAEDQGPLAPVNPLAAETVRISTAKLDSLLLQAEELLTAKLELGQIVAALREINLDLSDRKKQWAKVYSDARALRQTLDRDGGPAHQKQISEQASRVLEFLDWDNAFLSSLETRLIALEKGVERDHRSLGAMVDNLLDDMKRVLMLPFSSLQGILAKLVHDLSRDQGKEAELIIRGGEIEIDRRILEEMKDPFIHLLRNCIDHGIESPDERIGKGKAPRGTITITVSQKDSGKVEILIADDGAGIEAARVQAAALKLGIVSLSEAEKLDDKQILSLIFHSGVSTSPIITDISGRGLGLAIVREKVEKLGGVLSVETSPGLKAEFRIILPLTIATFRGIVIRAGDRFFVLPTLNVERVVRVKKSEIKTVENRDTIQLDGQAVSLVKLEDVLALPRQRLASNSNDNLPTVILDLAGRRIAFVIDEVLNEQEILVKSLGKQLSRVRNIAGATVLGAGRVVPILNVSDLMKSAIRWSAVATGPAAPAPEKEEARRKSILVVEDSITARMLLKNILEAAGYAVKTAVDGIDAFTQLKTGQFDLVVSDVDMPRMNGFDLTAKIRSDSKLAELPVILVTALESGKDKERGIDVGANAYIVKSSFDQSNLLDAIRRLI